MVGVHAPVYSHLVALSRVDGSIRDRVLQSRDGSKDTADEFESRRRTFHVTEKKTVGDVGRQAGGHPADWRGDILEPITAVVDVHLAVRRW